MKNSLAHVMGVLHLDPARPDRELQRPGIPHRPLLTLAAQLTELADQGPEALRAYLRNAGLGLLRKTRQLALSRDLEQMP